MPTPARQPSYSPEAAAYVTGLQAQVVRRWMYGDAKGQSVMMVDGREGIEFLDLIDLLAVSEIRTLRRIPLNRIRETVNACRTMYGIAHPFAMDHEVFLLGQDQIAIKIKGQLVQLTGAHKNQGLLQPIVQKYLKRISFNKKTGLAETFVPMERDGFRIEINPKRGAGLPMVTPVGYSVANLVYNVGTEGSVAKAAGMFKIAPAAVQLAVDYDVSRMRALQHAA